VSKKFKVLCNIKQPMNCSLVMLYAIHVCIEYSCTLYTVSLCQSCFVLSTRRTNVYYGSAEPAFCSKPRTTDGWAASSNNAALITTFVRTVHFLNMHVLSIAVCTARIGRICVTTLSLRNHCNPVSGYSKRFSLAIFPDIVL